ncbi:DUF2931 family protein [[Curtobacterium] plantarum]|uniref:DUF2931 family protein n=1 Tax=[Curtobacterium] plantarum TaxID=221276 RepID=A0ABT9T8N3_9GAMM|nr:DUF2931 family protein [[Curtobacterium] plantarum]MDQ0019831.1 hypothetical protein [[Curtobacterium] plantarum]
MRLKTLFPLLMLVMVSGCRAGEAQTPEDTGEMPYGEVDFAFFTPRALPAVVTKALIIDNEKVVSTYRTLDSIQENPDSVGSWSSRVSRHAQFNKARHPPAQMLFCWDSVIDKKTYETHITFSSALREKMSVPTGKDWRGDTAWYDTLLFGLAPEGKVRIWLQNSAPVANLPVEPVKITTLSGDKLDACKDVPSRIDFNYSIPDGYDQDIKDFIKGKAYPYGNW